MIIKPVLALTVLHHLLARWRLVMLIRCKLYPATRWCGLFFQVVFVAKTWGADEHELFRTGIERLHVVKGLGVTLLIEYLSVWWDSLARCLFGIIIIGIKLNHLFLRCVCYYIREQITTLNWLGSRDILKEVSRCVCLCNLVITLQVIVGSSWQSRMRVIADLDLLCVILIVEAEEVLQVRLLLTW